MTVRKDAAVPKEILEMLEEMRKRMREPGTAIDEPWFVVRTLVLAAVRQFAALAGRPPKLLYLPGALEAALQVDLHRHANYRGKLRERQCLFGVPVVWDAEEFRVE